MSNATRSLRARRRSRASSSRTVVVPYSSGWRRPRYSMLAPWMSSSFMARPIEQLAVELNRSLRANGGGAGGRCHIIVQVCGTAAVLGICLIDILDAALAGLLGLVTTSSVMIGAALGLYLNFSKRFL